MSEASRSPMIPAALREGDMLIGPDFVRVVYDGGVACGFDGCDWEMTGGTMEEQGQALIDHTRGAHRRNDGDQP